MKSVADGFKMFYNLKMTTQKQELTFQQQIARKRQEVINYEGVLERYRTGPSYTNRWYNSGRRTLEGLNDELKILKEKNKRHVRLNMSLVRSNRRAKVSKISENQALVHRSFSF